MKDAIDYWNKLTPHGKLVWKVVGACILAAVLFGLAVCL